ncbi:MAG: zf-HC2 domain-containing protein [Acidobacteriota bacterium]
MKCEDCQELLSLYLDSELEPTTVALLRAHLGHCAECAEMCKDLAAIIDAGRLDDSAESATVDADKIWRGIARKIEKENIAPEPRTGIFGRVLRLTFPQAASAVMGTVLVTSLLTFLAFNGLTAERPEVADAYDASLFERAMMGVGLMESPEEGLERRIAERREAIDYWNRRIEARRVQWDGQFQIAFERNLGEIDQIVNEYSRALEANPGDALTKEMLDSALSDKEELLRAFSEL